MNEKAKNKPLPRARNFREAMRLAPELLRRDIETLSKEEMAEKLTTYEPGVPHYWFGRPVEPITKEELLAFWSGGPDIVPRYIDLPQIPTATPNETRETETTPERELTVPPKAGA